MADHDTPEIVSGLLAGFHYYDPDQAALESAKLKQAEIETRLEFVEQKVAEFEQRTRQAEEKTRRVEAKFLELQKKVLAIQKAWRQFKKGSRT